MLSRSKLIDMIHRTALLESKTSVLRDRSATQPERWNAIKEYYKIREPEIVRACQKNVWIDPYDGNADWISYFTPIEDLAWGVIRCRPFPMFPQYPVGRRFVDFGNPHHKVALECDGAGYHNYEDDVKRDEELRAHGWTVYHVSGSDISREEPDWYELEFKSDEEALTMVRRWAYETVEGLMDAIIWNHCPQKACRADRGPIPFEEIQQMFEGSLREHCNLGGCITGLGYYGDWDEDDEFM